MPVFVWYRGSFRDVLEQPWGWQRLGCEWYKVRWHIASSGRLPGRLGMEQSRRDDDLEGAGPVHASRHLFANPDARLPARCSAQVVQNAHVSHCQVSGGPAGDGCLNSATTEVPLRSRRAFLNELPSKLKQYVHIYIYIYVPIQMPRQLPISFGGIFAVSDATAG